MRESSPGEARPERAGNFPTDASPYGVRDLAGGVADWVTPSSNAHPDELATRGGAWCDGLLDCRVVARRVYRPDEASIRVGFRLARSFTSSARGS
jgi:serine/threonine-protein kinase